MILSDDHDDKYSNNDWDNEIVYAFWLRMSGIHAGSSRSINDATVIRSMRSNEVHRAEKSTCPPGLWFQEAELNACAQVQGSSKAAQHDVLKSNCEKLPLPTALLKHFAEAAACMMSDFCVKKTHYQKACLSASSEKQHVLTWPQQAQNKWASST